MLKIDDRGHEMRALVDLDSLDRKIISALEEDGRRAYREIGRELHVPEATVRSRIGRLLSNGYVRITAVGNPLSLGVEVVAITLVRVRPGMAGETAKALAHYPNVRFVGTSFGSADIIIQTLHSSVRRLHEFVSQELPEVAPAVTSTETFQLADVIKSSWAWSEWFELQDQLEGLGT
jgi:Lrp/AsnC family transcriptional regulator for asnA, asnC and gidA